MCEKLKNRINIEILLVESKADEKNVVVEKIRVLYNGKGKFLLYQREQRSIWKKIQCYNY